jgi:hypothetical protein
VLATVFKCPFGCMDKRCTKNPRARQFSSLSKLTVHLETSHPDKEISMSIPLEHRS